MSLQFPENRKEISDRIKSDVKGQLPESNPFLRASFLQALIFGLAGRIFDLYQLSKTILKQIFWDTATGEFLERPAAYFGITKNAATGSTGALTIEGTPGTLIDAETNFQSSNGKEFQTTIDSSVINTSITTTIIQSLGLATATTPSEHLLAPGINVTISGAAEPEYNGTFLVISVPSANTFTYNVDSGAPSPATGTILSDYDTASLQMEAINFDEDGNDTNLNEGDELTITSPISGLNDSGFAQFEGFQGGTDVEDQESLRERFLFKVQNPVSLFNSSAIIVEAKKINGVTRVFVFGLDQTTGNISASSITSADQVAIFTAGAAHGLIAGQKVTVTGADQSEYNVISRKVIILDSTRFAYAISGTPATPATGTANAAHSLVEAGQLKVFFTRDNDESIIPSSSEVQDVKDQILIIKPAHMSDTDVDVKAPIENSISFSFSSITPNNSSMQEAIRNQLKAFFQEGTFVGENVLETQYATAIASTVDPNTGNRLQAFTLSSPSGNISIGTEELGTLGSITF